MTKGFKPINLFFFTGNKIQNLKITFKTAAMSASKSLVKLVALEFSHYISLLDFLLGNVKRYSCYHIF